MLPIYFQHLRECLALNMHQHIVLNDRLLTQLTQILLMEPTMLDWEDQPDKIFALCTAAITVKWHNDWGEEAHVIFKVSIIKKIVK